MIIPSKYQWSKENDPDNSLRINNITKKYTTCLKKFANSTKDNKLIANKDNKGYYFQEKIIEWFFNLSFIERVKVSSIYNKWVFQTLHQLYIEQKKKENLKFIPRITEKNIPFLENLKGKDIFSNNPGHFLNYFAFCSENYELINGYNEDIETKFLNEIEFIYPDLTKIAKLKDNDIGSDGDLIYLYKYYYPILTLSETILTKREKFLEFFKKMTNNIFFTMPPEVINPNKQKEISNDIKDNNLMNSFYSLNPLNNLMKNYNNSNNCINESNNNNNSNNSFNNKTQNNIIDLPIWAKQPANSKICFSVNELFLAFFEQNIIVYYMLFLYDKQYYQNLIKDKINTNIEEFISLKKELKDFLSINKENLLDILNIDLITKDIYYNSYIEKFVEIKKYQNNVKMKTKFWQDNKSFEEEYSLIKNYFNGYNNDNKSMTRLIQDISIFNIEQICSFEDFFLNKVLFNLNKKYENDKEKDLILDLTNNSQKETKKKKKKNKKNKKKQENEEALKKNTIINNDNNKNIIENKDNNTINNNIKAIEIKKYISIEEDEELSRIKKGYAKLDSNDSNNNFCESSGSENNCDLKPLLAHDDYKQIMIEKENKYNSNNEPPNNIINETELIETKTNSNNQNETKQENNNNLINEENDKNQNKEDCNEIKEEDNNKNEIIELDNKNNQESKTNNNKKKKNNFFLYPTIKKVVNDKNMKRPFIMKLNEDILSYNKYLLNILDSLSPIKEHIIETIKSHIEQCFLNENFFYQIEIYGSFKSHLDIVCSDIDMVFIPQKTKNLNICDLILELSNHLSSLNKYYKVTPIYTASIPLIKLMIKYENYLEENKSLLDNYSKLINSSIYKAYPYDTEKELSFVNIDISFPVNYNNKKNKNVPIHQIEFIQNSLSTYIEANIVIRILKRALKLTDMNNSYKGGLSSYTIFLIVISYMKNINKNNNMNNNKHKSNSYGHAFHDVIKFFSKFDFYSNIIDISNKNGEIYNKRNKKYNTPDYENIPIILDPVTGLNAGKSTFRINDVQNVLISLNEELEQLRNNYDKNNNNSNKNNIGNDKDSNNMDNLIITLLKNVENKYLNK